MPRVLEITLPATKTDEVCRQVKAVPQLISLRIERNISVQPAGDVLTVVVTDNSLPQLLSILERLEVISNPATSITTSRPLALISASSAEPIRNDSSYIIWEEVDQQLNKESSMTAGAVLVMAMAGVIAAVGMITNTLHLVIGAMVIAPGFEPITRFALGLVNRSPSWRKGLGDTFKAYLALIAGAALAAAALAFLGYGPSNTKASYLPESALLSYWTSISPTSLLATTAAAAAGALLVVRQRTVLTAGVMIALALIPAATMVGVGITNADPDLIATGALRLGIEAGIVTLLSILVFVWQLKSIQKRKMST